MSDEAKPPSPVPSAPEPRPPADPALTAQALEQSISNNDPRPLAALPLEELEKLKSAEQILEARFQAKKRADRIATLSQLLVGWVALAGFFANAYQSYNNKKHLEDRAAHEERKWAKEFQRAQTAEKRRAFFETSALVTDIANADRRLIGYALLEEFIADPDYHHKAVVILEESLDKELRASTGAQGYSDEHRNAVRQIVRTLSGSPSCEQLVYAARSIDKVASHARESDEGEAIEIFSMYVRRLVGRAAVTCKDEHDFDAVRQPIRDSLGKLPWLLGLSKTPPVEALNREVAKLLVERCVEEEHDTGVTDCPDIRRHYLRFCDDAAQHPAEWALEQAACDAVRAWPAPAAATATSPPPEPPEPK